MLVDDLRQSNDLSKMQGAGYDSLVKWAVSCGKIDVEGPEYDGPREDDSQQTLYQDFEFLGWEGYHVPHEN